VSAVRENPCAGRYAGCTADNGDARMCDNCRAEHNRRERGRRAALRAAAKCTVCGGRAVVVDGKALSTCKVHREYYRARAESNR
jgi:hypothetical protein